MNQFPSSPLGELTIFHGSSIYETKTVVFSGGELHVTIPKLESHLRGQVSVIARLQSAGSLIQLCLLKEILDRVFDGRRVLFIPYFPYARQDRVTGWAMAFSLKPIAAIINSLGFDEVGICDPHSDVTPALLNKARIVPQLNIIRQHSSLPSLISRGNILIVAPDAGAAKKAFTVAQAYGAPLITASKHRDTATGDITETAITESHLMLGRDALIVDDICDGGRTFIELAKVLRKAGAGRVYLYVTHGIFSKGLAVFRGNIDEIFTTDSFISPFLEALPDGPAVPLHVSPINPHLFTEFP